MFLAIKQFSDWGTRCPPILKNIRLISDDLTRALYDANKMHPLWERII